MLKDKRLIIFDWNGTLGQYDLTASPTLVEGARFVVETCYQQGFWLAIASSASRTQLKRVLEMFKLEPFFLAVQCGDDGFNKPHPGMIFAILDQLGVAPSEAIMVGDSQIDMQLAKNAGVDGILIQEMDIKQPNPVVDAKSNYRCIQTITEILNDLRQIPR